MLLKLTPLELLTFNDNAGAVPDPDMFWVLKPSRTNDPLPEVVPPGATPAIAPLFKTLPKDVNI